MDRETGFKKFSQPLPEIANYVQKLIHPEDEFLRQIRERSFRAGMPPIHVGHFDGKHLEVLSRAIQPMSIVEIGTLAGYSAVCLAKGLKPGGRLHTFDIQEGIATETFRLAGISHQITRWIGDATIRLKEIESLGPFDLVDADKPNYIQYLHWAAEHLRVGGTLIADNTFAWSMIHLDEFATSIPEAVNVRALREFNEQLAKHPCFVTTMLPTEEGLTVAVKVRS